MIFRKIFIFRPNAVYGYSYMFACEVISYSLAAVGRFSKLSPRISAYLDAVVGEPSICMRRLLQFRILREGDIESPSPKGKLRIAFPTNVLPSYFPGLFIDLPLETEAI